MRRETVVCLGAWRSSEFCMSGASDVLLCACGGRDHSRVRGGYLPPGAEKGWPANSGWRQENTEIADTERAIANLFVGTGAPFCSGVGGSDGSAQWLPVGWSASTKRASRHLPPDHNATATKVP